MEFHEHPVHQTLEEFQESLSGLSEKVLPESHETAVTVLSKAADYIGGILALAAPDISQRSRLDQLNKQLSESRDQVTTFLANENVGHLDNAFKHLWGALDQVAFLPIPDPEKKLLELGSILAAYRKNLEKTEEELNEKLAHFEGQFAKANDRIETLSLKAEEVDKDLTKTRERVDAVVSEFQEQFSQAQNERQTNFNAQLKEQRQQFESELESLQTQAETTLSSFSKDAGKLIQGIQSHEEKAKELVQLISDVAITGGYANAAKLEDKSATTMRVGAIVTMALMVLLVLVFTVQLFKEPRLDWWAILARYALVLVLLVPAAYLANESRNHRRSAERNRRYHLELTALEPYVSDLKPEDQLELKKQLAERYFGRHADAETTRIDAQSLGATEALIKRIIELIKTAR